MLGPRRGARLLFRMTWWWWWWWCVVQCSAAASSTPNTTPSGETTQTTQITSTAAPKDMAACRMGYSAMSYYPTEDNYYRHQTCFFCYHFVPRHRRRNDLKVDQQVVTLSDGRRRADFIFRVEVNVGGPGSVWKGEYHFDPGHEEAWGHVMASLADELEGKKLTSCCTEAEACCAESLSRPEAEEGDQCPGTWDGWHCFPPAAPGTSVTFTCPDYAYKGLPECRLQGHKHCHANGTWTLDGEGTEVTDYSTCSHRHHHLVTYTWEAVTHAVSLLALPPALFLLLYYRQLRVQRFFLHVNLFVALLGKAAFNVVDIVALRIPEYNAGTSLLDHNTVGCRFLVLLTKGFNMAVWTWMLAESLYLHRLIVAAFRGGGKTWVYLLVGWVPVVVVAGSWAACKATLEDFQCWLGDDPSTSYQLHLIFDVPKLLILIVNTVLLANMTRVLVTKLQGVNADHAAATRQAVKATIFLLPMFGVQFFLTLYLPPATTSCSIVQGYFFVATALDGLQGLYVSVVYCFINREVRLQVRRSLYRIKGHIYAHDFSSAAHDPRTDVSLLSTSHAPPPPHPAEVTTPT